MEEIHYRIPIRNRGVHPGMHRSYTSGGGNEFREYAMLLRSPDPRRVDLHASLKNPFGDLLVRVFNQRSAIPVTIVADLSASMGAPGHRGKLDSLSKFTRLLGFSVSRSGDRFGFIGCDGSVRTEFLYPPVKQSSFADIANRLEQFVPQGASAAGLASAGRYLGRSRGLVFLVSDYLFPQTLLRQVLHQLSHQVIVPVMLIHDTEIDGPAGYGMARVVDSETGVARRLWLRPFLRKRIQERYRDHRQQFERVCAGYGLHPLWLAATFSAEDITCYFYPVDNTR